MARFECIHEDDVLLMVQTGRWPERAPQELREHAAGCQVCRDLAVIAQTFEEETDAAEVDAPQLPTAGTVWWKAQLRARQEAARVAVRPITATQAFAFAALVGVVGAVFGATAVWFQDTLHWFGVRLAGIVASIHLPSLPQDLSTVSLGAWILVIAVGFGVLGAAFVVGWAMREE